MGKQGDLCCMVDGARQMGLDTFRNCRILDVAAGALRMFLTRRNGSCVDYYLTDVRGQQGGGNEPTGFEMMAFTVA